MDFFWGFKGQRKKMHLKNASVLKATTSRGGLGFKDSKLVNKALLAK